MPAAPPTAPPAVEQFLAGFHNRCPGGSARAFGDMPVHDAEGTVHASSYHALVAALADAQAPVGQSLPPPAPQAGPTHIPLPEGPVLDLACGDGHLLALLQGATPRRPLLGVDLSRGELAAARTRLGPAVALHQARAQALPLADASLAAVASHMALMLMADAPQVVAEIARVLRPGGRLLALVPRAERPGTARPPLVQAWVDALRPEARDTTWQQVRFDGRAWCDSAALPGLLQPAFGPPRLTALDAQTRLSPDEAWAWFTGMYDLHLLPAPAWPAVQSRFAALLPPLQGTDGRVPLQHAYLLIDASRAS